MRRFKKRYSRGRVRGGSTNYVTATYQEIYDINTVSNDVTVIGIHTPIGSKPRSMLSGFLPSIVNMPIWAVRLSEHLLRVCHWIF